MYFNSYLDVVTSLKILFTPEVFMNVSPFIYILLRDKNKHGKLKFATFPRFFFFFFYLTYEAFQLVVLFQTSPFHEGDARPVLENSEMANDFVPLFLVTKKSSASVSCCQGHCCLLTRLMPLQRSLFIPVWHLPPKKNTF